MNWLVRALSSSIGKKYLVAVSGLLLSVFLVVHLAGNVLLYISPQAYNDYAHALHEQEWAVRLAEVVLLILFALHIVVALAVSKDNRTARRLDYERKESKHRDRHVAFAISPERWMLVTGLIVLAFLIVHLIDFTFEARPDIAYEELDPFNKAVALLQTPLTFGLYTVGSLLLGWHLGHGAWSLFQSLGINHPKYNGLIKWGGVAFAVVMGLGFASFPVWAWLTQSAPTGGAEQVVAQPE